MPRNPYPHIKKSKAKGKEYYYFRTGQRGPDGKEILTPLPPMGSLGFGGAYATALGARSKRREGKNEVSVTELCDLWEKSAKWTKPKADKGYAEGTKKIYRIGLAYLKAKLPTAPAGLLERKDIALLIDQRADQPGAANSLLRTINSLYKWARERGHVTNDPGKDVPELEMGEHEPWPLPILEAALKAKDDRVRLGTHLLYFTAQRIEDVVNIRWTDRRTNERGEPIIFVKQRKTGRELEIPLHDQLAAELAKWEPGIGYVLHGSKAGRPMHQNTLRQALQDFAGKLGVEIVPHGLRKNAVNALLEAGCSAAEAASISGQSLSMVEHYAKGRAQGRLASAAILKWNKK